MTFYNHQNMDVSLSSFMAEEPFENLTTAVSLANMIDLASESSEDVHGQQSHVWINSEPLNVEFDLGESTLLSHVHFWNYHTEEYDADSVKLTFLDSNRQVVDTFSFEPDLGSGIVQHLSLIHI